jgi:hypothetical protein
MFYVNGIIKLAFCRLVSTRKLNSLSNRFSTTMPTDSYTVRQINVARHDDEHNRVHTSTVEFICPKYRF